MSQSTEFHQINTELGYTYESSAVIEDGSAPHVPVDPVRIYQPRARPGHPLPHAYVERESQRVPIGNLVHTGRFLSCWPASTVRTGSTRRPPAPVSRSPPGQSV